MRREESINVNASASQHSTDISVSIGSRSSGRESLLSLSNKVVKASASGISTRNVTPLLAQLRTTNMHLHGREDDLKFLKTKLNELSKGKDENLVSRPELLLVAGVSGSGKSVLVRRGLQDPAQKRGVAFASGKFDLNTNTALSLSAFADTMSSLTKYIMVSQTQKDVEKIKDGLKESLERDEIMLLLRAMPGCEDLFCREGRPVHRSFQNGSENDLNIDPDHDRRRSVGGKEAIAQLHHHIRTLLKVICTNLKGTVLFLDDLQWIDTSTLNLIKSISFDDEIPSLLIVGAYRADEVPDSHPLALLVHEKEQAGATISTIKVGDLTCSNIKSLVAEALGMEDDEAKVDTLATTVFNKTDGNPFFSLFFLKSLYDEELLGYNFGIMKWIWDDDVVKAKLMTQNRATVMVNKLRRFKKNQQTVLRIASVLGASFSLQAVTIVMDALFLKDTATKPALSLVSECANEIVEEGLWERDTAEFFCFSHDQIQSAAFELIPPEERDSFRGQIGDILTEKLDADMLEECLFVVVSLRNCAIAQVSSKNERIALARMNLHAGIKASTSAAFESAAVYFGVGWKLLGPKAWDEDPNTMLQLCSEGASAAFINGDIKTQNSLVEEVLSKNINVKDKFRVYEIKILSMQAENQMIEAVDLALEVRKRLGLTAPRNKPASSFTILKEFIKTNRMLKNWSAEKIASLPELKDERHIMGQRLLELLLISSHTTQPTLFPLISCLLVRTSVKYGLNASSCDAFASFGVLLCFAFGRMKRGRDMAEAVSLILAKPGMKRTKSRAILLSQICIYPWIAPLRTTVAPLLEGYQVGLETGDVESAAYNLLNLTSHRWFTARSLERFEAEIETAVDILAQLNQTPQKMYLLPYLLTVKNLRGVHCEEDEMTFEAMLGVATEAGGPARAITIITHLELLVMNQDWAAAKSLLLEGGELHSNFAGEFISVKYRFIEGLICFKAAAGASKGEKKKWEKRGVNSKKIMKGWLKKGNPNVVHMMHLLTAELAALKGNNADAEEAFKSAITVATLEGLLQDKALAHELAGAYYAERSDNFWAKYHFEGAEKSYSDWGAIAKVEELTKRMNYFSMLK